jgi:two-component system, NtrC family, sensor kinase
MGDGKGTGGIPAAESSAPPGMIPAAQADRLAAISALAGGVVHELGSSLAVLVTNLTVAAEQLLAAQASTEPGGPPPELGAELEEALEAAQRLRVLVGDLKSFARMEQPGGTPTDLRPVFESVLRLLEHEFGARGRLEVEFGPVPRITLPEAKLSALLLHVCVHVLQRLPHGATGPVTVQVATRSQGPEILFALYPAPAPAPAPEPAAPAAAAPSEGPAQAAPEAAPAAEAAPLLADAPAPAGVDQAALAEALVIAGFAFARSLAEQHGGRLEELASQSGGSLLRLRLPSAGLSTRPPSDPTLLTMLPPPKVLVIDDEPLLCEAVKRMLAGEATIHTATDPAAALGRLLSGERFDAVLCDLLMPHKNGMQLFAELQEKRPELAARLGFVTGGAFSEDAQAFLREHGERVLEKPFSRSGLRGLLRTLLSGKFAAKG